MWNHLGGLLNLWSPALLWIRRLQLQRVGYSQRRACRCSHGSRQPRQLSWCCKWRYGYVHRKLGHHLEGKYGAFSWASQSMSGVIGSIVLWLNPYSLSLSPVGLVLNMSRDGNTIKDKLWRADRRRQGSWEENVPWHAFITRWSFLSLTISLLALYSMQFFSYRFLVNVNRQSSKKYQVLGRTHTHAHCLPFTTSLTTYLLCILFFSFPFLSSPVSFSLKGSNPIALSTLHSLSFIFLPPLSFTWNKLS